MSSDWWDNTGNTTDTFQFTFTHAFTSGTNTNTRTFFFSIAPKNQPDKNWMPYTHFEYDHTWHKKYARYKIQMERMWD